MGLIEAGHRLPTEAVVRALAGVLERDADEWIRLRSEADSQKRLVELAQHIDPAAFAGVAQALTHMRATLDSHIHELDPASLAAGAKRLQDFLDLHGQTPMSALKQPDDADVATRETAVNAGVAAERAAAWLSGSGGPRRGRRYELATKLFGLVADLDVDEMQRVIGYTEAVREGRPRPSSSQAK